jgi:DNA-directed RNA polymerase specialized sigma24 family protein
MYSESEVEGVLESWEQIKSLAEAQGTKRTEWVLVRYLDVSSGITGLPSFEKSAVWSIGICGLSLRQASELSGIPTTSLWRRYRQGIERLTKVVNGRI